MFFVLALLFVGFVIVLWEERERERESFNVYIYSLRFVSVSRGPDVMLVALFKQLLHLNISVHALYSREKREREKERERLLIARDMMIKPTKE